MNLNKVFLLGRLTQDPQRRVLPSGQPVVNFGIATNRYYTQGDEKREETEFHNVVAFGKIAERVAQYLRKGSLVLVEGRLRTRNWQDSSGNKRYRTEIIVERLQLGPKSLQPSVQETIEVSDTLEEIPTIEEQEKVTEGKKEDNSSEQKKDNQAEKEEKEIDIKEIPF